MGVILAIILMRLFSFAAADPPSSQDYVMCSQIFTMHQYCMSKLSPTSAAPDNVPTLDGAPGMVNKTEINEEIARRFAEWEAEMGGKFEALKSSVVEEMKEMKVSVANATKDLEHKIEKKFTRWSRKSNSKIETMRAEIDSEKKDVENEVEHKFASWKMKAESDMRAIKAWIEKRDESFPAASTSTVPHVVSTTDPTTIASTAEPTTKSSCNIAFNGTCYWTHVEHGRPSINFARAEEICSNKASTPAHFPNEEVYNSVVQDLRSKIPSEWSSIVVWTGITVDPNTGTVTHPSGDTYVKWYPRAPFTGFGREDWTKGSLDVESEPWAAAQAVYNNRPKTELHGVVCQSVE